MNFASSLWKPKGDGSFVWSTPEPTRGWAVCFIFPELFNPRAGHSLSVGQPLAAPGPDLQHLMFFEQKGGSLPFSLVPVQPEIQTQIVSGKKRLYSSAFG